MLSSGGAPIEGANRIRDRPGIAIVCVGVSGMNSAVALALAPALPAIARDLGGAGDGTFIAQMIQTIPALTMIIGSFISAYCTAMFGRRAVLSGAALVFALAGLAGMVMHDVLSLSVSRGIHGLAAGILLTSSYAAVGEYFHGSARTRMLGFCAATGSAFAMVVPIVAGQMVDLFGWRSAFLLFIAEAAFVPVILASFTRSPVKAMRKEPLSWKPILAMWPLWLTQIAYTIGLFMSVVQVPFLAVAKGVNGAGSVSVLIATTSAVATAVALTSGSLRRRLNFFGTLALISVGFGGGLLLYVAGASMPMFLLGAVLLGIGCGPLEPTIISRALETTPTRSHDQAAGLAIATLYLGQFLNPVVVYPLAKAGGIGFAVGVIGVAYLAGAALFVLAAVAGDGLRRKESL